MAKKVESAKPIRHVVKRRAKPVHLRHRKKLGPRSNMRVAA